MFVQKNVFSKAIGRAFGCKDMGFSNSLQTHQVKIKVFQTHNILIVSLDKCSKQDKNLNVFNPYFPSFSPQNLEKKNIFPIFAA
jgi:hypothetical protein